jgi:hypothetical protein
MARKLDSAYDPAGIVGVLCLYKLGKLKEAWEACRVVLRDGRPQLYEEPTIYYAGLAAHHSGESDIAERLLRQARHRFPLNDLAQQTRELIK